MTPTDQRLLPAEALTYDAIGNRRTGSATPPGAGSASAVTYANPNTAATDHASRSHTLASMSGAQTTRTRTTPDITV